MAESSRKTICIRSGYLEISVSATRNFSAAMLQLPLCASIVATHSTICGIEPTPRREMSFRASSGRCMMTFAMALMA